jgi:hypothetical protein
MAKSRFVAPWGEVVVVGVKVRNGGNAERRRVLVGWSTTSGKTVLTPAPAYSTRTA